MDPNANPNTNPNVANTGTHTGGGHISSLKTAVRGVQGASDVLRGTINHGVNTAFGNHEGAARDKAVTERGLNKMGYTGVSGVSSGPAPLGGVTGQQHPLNQAAVCHTGGDPMTGTGDYAPTHHGPHATGAGNKLDPRVGDGVPNRTAAEGTAMPGAVEQPVDYDRRPDVATTEQGATTEAGHHKKINNPSAINFKFWKKDKGDTGKGDNTLTGTNGSTHNHQHHQENPASTNYDAPYTESTQTHHHQYQPPTVPPREAEYGTAGYRNNNTATTNPNPHTSKFAEKLGASGTRTEDPPAATMD